MVQLFEYQTLNKLSIGVEDEIEHSYTGYYVNLTSNDSDIFYKMVNETSDFYILFDLNIGKDIDSTNFIKDWVKIFDFYNDKTPNNNLKLCYKQLKSNKFQMAILTNKDVVLGNIWYVNINEINTFEFHVIRGNVTNIEIYINLKLAQTVIDNTIGAGIINRFSFYCTYEDNMNVCLSHIIYNDVKNINNERIKMLRTDVTQRLIANGGQETFTITEILDNTVYSTVTGLGIITSVENTDTNATTVTEFLGTNAINKFSVDANKKKYNSVYLSKDPSSSSDFKASEITNKKILINTKK